MQSIIWSASTVAPLCSRMRPVWSSPASSSPSPSPPTRRCTTATRTSGEPWQQPKPSIMFLNGDSVEAQHHLSLPNISIRNVSFLHFQ